MKKDKLLPIGYISKSLGVSENTIRRMESEGLLKPACLNTSTGYRFYDSDNLSRAAVILGLKTFGFTNREIGEYLKEPDNNSSLYNSLMQKKRIIDYHLRVLDRCANGAFPELSFYEGAYYFCIRQTTALLYDIIPHLLKNAMFEAAKRKMPIDHTLAIIINTECTDFSVFDPLSLQEITVCIPLRSKINDPDVVFMPSCRVVEFWLTDQSIDHDTLISAINTVMSAEHVTQCGTVRAAIMTSRCIESDCETSLVLQIYIPVD